MSTDRATYPASAQPLRSKSSQLHLHHRHDEKNKSAAARKRATSLVAQRSTHLCAAMIPRIVPAPNKTKPSSTNAMARKIVPQDKRVASFQEKPSSVQSVYRGKNAQEATRILGTAPTWRPKSFATVTLTVTCRKYARHQAIRPES
jgi:hypothetical protein